VAADLAKSEADKKVLQAKAEKKALDLAKKAADQKLIDDAAKKVAD